MESIGKYISIISRQFQIYISRELKDYDVTGSEYIFIVNVPKHGFITQKEICDEFSLDPAFATRGVKSLEKKGFVIRTKNENDKRSHYISLTEKGRVVQPIIQEKLQNWTRILAGGDSHDEIKNAVNKLQIFTRNALKEISKN